jgi:hypothetical protein
MSTLWRGDGAGAATDPVRETAVPGTDEGPDPEHPDTIINARQLAMAVPGTTR